jgi:hypothetical protein
VVTLTETTGDQNGTSLRVDRASLRFLDAATLDRLLDEAGFRIEARYGGWHRERFGPESAEIVTVVVARS